ncbi:hypothetical protein EV138_3732 [Kribbella voronezhensis]|uniref:TPM domain-containing protein n=1 Tax=Kribbella voronezhensis TaxID=2512212 RepID=A0A4R7TFD3_9ACTN|nr:hypothetical protein [Kribbella voronezhensis]TDU90148.1 hypothetical protein EV138_3732 [Kribbella voronezhensis]
MRRLLLALAAGLLVVLTTTTPAHADFRSDPRVTAAVAAWKTNRVYVDPLFAGSEGFEAESVRQVAALIARAPVPVYAAALPTGPWFPEKEDVVQLAGWLAVANGKPGLYLVLDQHSTSGAAHLIAVRSPRTTYATSSKATAADEVAAYLEEVEVDDSYQPRAARTTPLPDEPEPTYEPEPFTPAKAIGNGLGGFTLGLLGGAILALPVLGLAALVARRREGQS